jgi:hypothetical protein
MAEDIQLPQPRSQRPILAATQSTNPHHPTVAAAPTAIKLNARGEVAVLEGSISMFCGATWLFGGMNKLHLLHCNREHFSCRVHRMEQRAAGRPLPHGLAEELP